MELDTVLPRLAERGFTRTGLDRNVDDPNEIVVIHEVGDLDRAHEFYGSDEYRQCIRKAGVVGEPAMTFLEELAAAPLTAGT